MIKLCFTSLFGVIKINFSLNQFRFLVKLKKKFFIDIHAILTLNIDINMSVFNTHKIVINNNIMSVMSL